MKSLTPVEHRVVRADAFLMYAREFSGWRAAQEPTAQPVPPEDDEPALAEHPPHRHSAAWFREMRRRNRRLQRSMH